MKKKIRYVYPASAVVTQQELMSIHILLNVVLEAVKEMDDEEDNDWSPMLTKALSVYMAMKHRVCIKKEV